MGKSPAELRKRQPSEGRPSVRDELRELTRQRILAGAQIVFERDGYTSATIGNITDEASVNRATFYHHFADKTELLAALWKIHLDTTPAYWGIIDDALVSGDIMAIRNALASAIEWYETHGKIIPAVTEATAIHPDFMLESASILQHFPEAMSTFLAEVSEANQLQARLRLGMLVAYLDQIGQRIAAGHAPIAASTLSRDDILDESAKIWAELLLSLKRS